MSHYDSFYEEEAARHREETRRRQARCSHNWVPIQCDSRGNTVRIQCRLCNKVKDIK